MGSSAIQVCHFALSHLGIGTRPAAIDQRGAEAEACNLFYETARDEMLPDTQECMRRAGIDGEVAHTALEDARLVVELVRRY